MNDRIVRLAARGDGVTESGRFVPGTAPGDLVDDVGGITPGPEHAQAPCRHYGTCGGCQLQHVSDAAFAGYVTDRIVEALRAQGLALPEIRAPHLSPPHARRRAGMRGLKLGKRVALGFAEAKSHRLVDLAECPVLHPALFALVAPLRALLPHLMRDKRPADIRMTLADQGVDLTLAGVAVDGLAATEALSDFAAANKLARLSIDEGYGAAPRWEPEPVTVTLGGVAVPLPEGAFLQATADGEAALVAAVRDAIGKQVGVGPTIDLFSGLGTFSLALDGPVLAVEGARDAIAALQAAANRAQRLVTCEHRDLFRRPVTAKELARFSAAVIDPPRAGAKEQMAELAASSVSRIASVSCNPSTFARDAKLLVDGGYRLDWIQPVGQFRWSTHVELAAAFCR